MARTSLRVSFGLFAMSIKQDAAFTCPDEQTFSKVADLKTGNVVTRPLISYEPDFWLLSGEYKIKLVSDTAVRVGLMSLSLSDATGAFAIPPVLTITFSQPQTADSLNIRFAQASDDYASDLDIAYYDADDVLLVTTNYTPETWEISTGLAVSNFQKIVVTFNETNKPYRYLRVTGVDFGTLVYFKADQIKSATVVEEVNPLSVILPVNTLDLSLFSSDATFSIINPSGDYSALEERQPLDVYERIGAGEVYIGQYYLDKWENPSNNQVEFRCIDLMGILETLPYLGGIWTTATTAGALIDEILSAANIPYFLDASLESVEIKGWIPVTNCRAALQQIAFAIGAYVTTSRTNIIEIYPFVLAADVTSFTAEITKSEKSLQGQSLTLKTLITGVSVTSHNYVTNATVRTLYNASLAAGIHTIKFTQPAHTLSITGGTITESGANYAIVDVASTGAVAITGRGYDDTAEIVTVETPGLSSSVRKKVLEVKDATLINPDNAGDTAQRVYDYYQQRYLQKVKLFANLAKPGEPVLIDTLYDRQLAGIIEKMTTNLTGGFLNTTEIVGVISDAV